MLIGSQLGEENMAKPIHDKKKSMSAPNDRDVIG
jgi:hypothetical protein